MQLYALDGTVPILATAAEKQKNYICPECQSPVRLREGPHRQAHFYHFNAAPFCQQHKKSLTHLRIQLILHSLFPGSAIEKPYPQIGRIADVSWEEKALVFEVQCSPISLSEAEERCRDYEKIGLTPIWILHDKRYNKWRLNASEAFLRQRPCYYTNINASGQGIFYDQFEVFKGAKRRFTGVKLKINLTEPKKITSFLQPPFEWPKLLHFRLNQWNLYFEGDLLDRSLEAKHPSTFSGMLRMENHKKKEPFSLLKWLKDCYLSFFYSILETVCSQKS